MLTLASASTSLVGNAMLTTPRHQMAVRMETADDLKSLAVKLNPQVGYWNPLGLGDTNKDPTSGNTIDWWGESDEAAIGWLRHAEIKHGRVAMAAFVGYCVQANGICFPWKLTGLPSSLMLGGGEDPVTTFAQISAAGGPADQWDALPTLSKLQIFGAIAFLEVVGESSYALKESGTAHYMRGGKPGVYPSLKGSGVLPHPVPLDLWDPFGFTKKMTPERKEKALLAEINNGRLAMIGIMGMVSASKGLIVPGLNELGIPKYSGEVMAPFSATDTSLTGVQGMLDMAPQFPMMKDPFLQLIGL